MHIEKLNGKKWWNMTPLNYNFFNTCYWDVRCISLYEFQNYLPTLWSVALPRLCLLRKKAMEEDHNWRSIFLPFLFKTNFTLSFSFIDTSLEKQLSWLLSVYPFSSHQMLEIWRKSHVCQAVAHPDTCDVMWSPLQPGQPSFDSWHSPMSKEHHCSLQQCCWDQALLTLHSSKMQSSLPAILPT